MQEDEPPRRQGPPLIGDPAPAFTARTTMGERALRDFAGRWLLFLSHPADFTPVCTSEFIAFSRLFPAFEAEECAILALSVDSLYSHLAWVRAIEHMHGVVVPFPVVEDPTMVIARAYGMLHNDARDSATVRASFVIDPVGTVRATTCYPLTTGRSASEHLRLVQALRASDRTGGLAPENWQVSEPLLRPPPASIVELASGGMEDWLLLPLGSKQETARRPTGRKER
jgi:peroxiredoxin (alkyl hydroperoxide reductase subunit C)